MGDRAGQQFGNYRLLHLIGQGGFAEVYLGEHIHLGTYAAVKVLHTQLAGEDVASFRNEARTIARLEHPNIVRVLDFGLEGTIPYLAMSYAPNGSLRQRHPRGTPLPLPTIVSYMGQIAAALQYAHDEKFIHRDIKPENMLLDRHNSVLLSDFGIALVAQSTKMQSVQEVIGTVAYMAPEMLQGHPKPASDQYALAVVVYEWLSGDRPFHGAFTELASQHMFVPPPPLREKVPAISPELEHVVLTALSKEPSQRFGSVRAFANALEQARKTAEPGVERGAFQAPAPSFSIKEEHPISDSRKEVASLPPTYFPPTQLTTPSQPSLPATRYEISSNPVLPPTQFAAPAQFPSTAQQTTTPPRPGFAPTEYAQPDTRSTSKEERKVQGSAPRRGLKNFLFSSRPTLADYLFPAQTSKGRLLRDVLLIVGGIVALFLWTHIYFNYYGGHLSFSLEIFMVLLISAFLGKWRTTATMIIIGVVGISQTRGGGFSATYISTLASIRNFSIVGFAFGSYLHIGTGLFKGFIYLAAAFIIGWLCEWRLDRRFRSSIPIMLAIALLVSIAGFQLIRVFYDFYVLEPISWAFSLPFSVYFPAILGYCIQGFLAALIVSLLWKLPGVKRQMQQQELHRVNRIAAI